jgi:hypothetical protein
MIKKSVPLFFLLLLLTKAYAQQAGYDFPKPRGWNTEKIFFPIDFAKNIPFQGTEELRFTPGWGNSKTDEYWGYDLLWFVKGLKSVKKGDLDKYIMQYFNGLYLSNLKNKTNAPSGFTKAGFKKAKAQQNDKETFKGGIKTLDFLTGQPIAFNAKVHVRNYPGVQHTAILFEISPQAYKNVVWDCLDGVVNGFAIKK